MHSCHARSCCRKIARQEWEEGPGCARPHPSSTTPAPHLREAGPVGVMLKRHTQAGGLRKGRPTQKEAGLDQILYQDKKVLDGGKKSSQVPPNKTNKLAQSRQGPGAIFRCLPPLPPKTLKNLVPSPSPTINFKIKFNFFFSVIPGIEPQKPHPHPFCLYFVFEMQSC